MPLDPRIPLQIQHFDVGPAIDEYYRSVDNKRRTNAQKLADMAAQQQLELNEAEISEIFRKRKEAEELRKILGEAYGLPENTEGGGFQGYPDAMGMGAFGSDWRESNEKDAIQQESALKADKEKLRRYAATGEGQLPEYTTSEGWAKWEKAGRPVDFEGIPKFNTMEDWARNPGKSDRYVYQAPGPPARDAKPPIGIAYSTIDYGPIVEGGTPQFSTPQPSEDAVSNFQNLTRGQRDFGKASDWYEVGLGGGAESGLSVAGEPSQRAPRQEIAARGQPARQLETVRDSASQREPARVIAENRRVSPSDRRVSPSDRESSPSGSDRPVRIPGHLTDDQIRRIGQRNPEMANKIRREQKAEVLAIEKAEFESKKGKAELEAKQFELFQKRMDFAREQLVGILSIPEAERPEAYQDALLGMQKMGIDISQLRPTYSESFVRKQVAGLASFARTSEQRRQEQAEARAQGEYDATIGGKRAESESKVRSGEFAKKDPDNLTPEQRAAQKRAKEAQESADRRFREGQSAADRRAAAGRAVTMRGQDIADQRAKREPADKVTQGALKDLANLDTALESLGSLRKVIEANPDKMGPVSGRLRQIPWLGASRQIVNADIERVRQEVGRAMEGGVLRKEDEEKYKRILPAMEDLPEVARYKLDQLEAKLKQDIQKYVGRQQEGQRGRDLSAPARPRMGASEDGFVFMGGDPGDKKNWKRAK